MSFFIFIAVACVSAQEVFAIESGTIIGNGVRVRERPSTSSAVTRSLCFGEKVKVLGRSTFTTTSEDCVSPWLKVRTSDGLNTGWVFGVYVDLTLPLDNNQVFVFGEDDESGYFVLPSSLLTPAAEKWADENKTLAESSKGYEFPLSLGWPLKVGLNQEWYGYPENQSPRTTIVNPVNGRPRLLTIKTSGEIFVLLPGTTIGVLSNLNGDIVEPLSNSSLSPWPRWKGVKPELTDKYPEVWQFLDQHDCWVGSSNSNPFAPLESAVYCSDGSTPVIREGFRVLGVFDLDRDKKVEIAFQGSNHHFEYLEWEDGRLMDFVNDPSTTTLIESVNPLTIFAFAEGSTCWLDGGCGSDFENMQASGWFKGALSSSRDAIVRKPGWPNSIKKNILEHLEMVPKQMAYYSIDSSGTFLVKGMVQERKIELEEDAEPDVGELGRQGLYVNVSEVPENALVSPIFGGKIFSPRGEYSLQPGDADYAGQPSLPPLESYSLFVSSGVRSTYDPNPKWAPRKLKLWEVNMRGQEMVVVLFRLPGVYMEERVPYGLILSTAGVVLGDFPGTFGVVDMDRDGLIEVYNGEEVLEWNGTRFANFHDSSKNSPHGHTPSHR